MNSGLSVVIPVFNREKLIGQTLRSILQQTQPADEIIVVDDGSTDGTVNVVRQLDPSIKVITQTNSGPAVARNTGLSEAKGEFIHFYDSDDVAAPNKHEVQLRTLKESGADIVYSPWVKGEISSHSFKPQGPVLQARGLPKEDLTKALLTDWSIVPHAAIFRTDLAKKVNGFPAELLGTEDQQMFLNCLLDGAKVVFAGETINHYRADNSDKITSTNDSAKQSHVRAWAHFLITAQKSYQTHAINPSQWRGYRRRVWQAIQDLDTFEIDEAETKRKLKKLLNQGDSWSFPLENLVLQKAAGLKSRLTGSRYPASFRTAPFTEGQWDFPPSTV